MRIGSFFKQKLEFSEMGWLMETWGTVHCWDVTEVSCGLC